jgi:hypothetical protein
MGAHNDDRRVGRSGLKKRDLSISLGKLGGGMGHMKNQVKQRVEKINNGRKEENHAHVGKKCGKSRTVCWSGSGRITDHFA